MSAISAAAHTPDPLPQNAAWQRAEWVSHPGPLFEIVQKALQASSIAHLKPVLTLIVEHLQRADIFGPDEWQKFFHAKVPQAPASLALDTTLQQPCPFWPDKLVSDTHAVVYIPSTINGEGLTLFSMGRLTLGALASTPQVTIKHHYGDHRVTPAMQSASPFPYWALLLKTKTDKTANKEWEVPFLCDALICVTALFAQTGQWLYPSQKIPTRKDRKIEGGCFVVMAQTEAHSHTVNIHFESNETHEGNSNLVFARTFGKNETA